MVETKFGSKAMQLFASCNALELAHALRREGTAIRDNARAQDIRKEQNGLKRGIGAKWPGVSTGHGVVDHNVLVENLVEQLVGMVQKGSRRMEIKATDELGEDSHVIWRWVLMVKAWICLSSLREVQWGQRNRGGEVIIVLGFGGEEENGLIWRALAAAICVGCVVLCLCDSEVVQGKTC